MKILFLIKLIFFLLVPGISICSVSPTVLVKIPSSFQPVGSGARALAMSAFMAVVDDATAASWNPGGLSNLKKFECSIVTAYKHLSENSRFNKNPEASGPDRISNFNINYFSLAYPFKSFNKNMIMALTYQRLYDLDRKWNFMFHDKNTTDDYKRLINYEQHGSLSAIGFSYCIDIFYELAIGFTLNLWDNKLSDNAWDIKNNQSVSGKIYDIKFSAKMYEIEKFVFSGFNVNLGFLWHANDNFTIGGVIKTPFNAKIKHTSNKYENSVMMFDGISPETNQEGPIKSSTDENMNMPMSYGLGCMYKMSDAFYLSGDVYRTDWNKFIYRNSVGDEKSPISGKKIDKSNIKPTTHIRIGGEYYHKIIKTGDVIRLRGGLFYDPVPAEENPDDFFGFSIGTGYVKKNPYANSDFYDDLYSVDIAYQFRSGRDEGKSLMKSRGFSQKRNEHKIYISMIFYGFSKIKQK